MSKYHVVSYNHLRHTRKIFKDKDEIIPFLLKLKKRCEGEYRERQLASLKEKLHDERIHQKEFDYESDRIQDWKGYNHDQLCTSIRILAFDESVWEGCKILTE